MATGYSNGKNVYLLTSEFPITERYGLLQQIRRAAVSVPSNIAEGQTRGTKEFIHFLRIYSGSLAELETQLIIASDLSFIAKDQTTITIADLDSLRRQIHALIRGLNV